jgi:uncharacterized protein YkwD
VSLTAAARFRYTMVAGATAVVIGSGFTVIGLGKHADAETRATAADRPLVIAESVDPTAADPTVAPPPPTTPAPSVTPSRSPSTRPAVKKTTTKVTTPAPKKSAAKVPSTGNAILDAVLAHINEARAGEGLGALTLDARLSKASALHNQQMISGCGLEHRCAGEADLGPRFTAQGVNWTSAGENIGFGSSGSSDADIIKAANGLCDSMLAEVPPNDGHRKNLLNSGFKRIGLSVVRDGKGITWLTQDFVN